MKNEKLLLFILAVVQFAHIIDFMIIMPLGAQFMELFQISPQQFSLIVSSYAIAAFVTSLVGALYLDRFDRKKALLFLFFGFAVSTLACALTTNYVLFLAARSLTGAFGGMLSSLVLSIVADAIPFERRSAAIGIIMTAFSVASVVGVPAGIYLAAEFSWRMPFIVIGLLSLLGCGLIQGYLPSLTDHLALAGDRSRPLEVLRRIARNRNQLSALLFSILLMLGHFTIIPFIAPYMQLNIGFSDHEVAYIYLVGGLLTVFLLPFFGRLADRVGNPKVFTGASALALFSILAITNLGPVSIVIALCVTSSYFVVSSGRSVPATTMVTSVVDPEHRAGFMSVRSSVNQLGLGLASLISGSIVIEQNGALANYHYAGYFAIFMSILAIYLAWQLKLNRSEGEWVPSRHTADKRN
ncbi:MAG: MFS transporter [Bacteroidota bacterium]